MKFINNKKNKNKNKNKNKKKSKKKTISLRAIMGQPLSFSNTLMGVDSFPGPVTTYSPSLPTKPIVNLGCLNSTMINDIIPIKSKWPSNTNPYDFATRKNNDIISNLTTNTGINNNFQSTVYLSSDVTLYGNSGGASSSRYSNITLSQEGLLWTLWPLAKKQKNDSNKDMSTYFNTFSFGTSLSSEYSIGQLGFFTNNLIIGCTPFGGTNPNSGNTALNIETDNNPSLNNYSPGILPGVETLNQALIYNAGQQVGIVVVKISEQISRIFNPISSVSSDSRFIYVGYDAWSIILTSNNPLGPMMAQTYITPQTVTGSVVGNNYQVILPPNFPEVVYYKNQRRIVPVDTDIGLFAGTAFTAGGTGIGPIG